MLSVGLRLTASGYFGIWGAMMLAVLVAQSLGLLIGACVQDMAKAQLVAQTVTLTSVLIGEQLMVTLM
jgi:hypothetical protein